MSFVIKFATGVLALIRSSYMPEHKVCAEHHGVGRMGKAANLLARGSTDHFWKK